jgi:hypothetical protein
LSSSNLSPKENFCDLDVLTAAGLAQTQQTNDGKLTESPAGALGILLVEAYEAAAGTGPHEVRRVKNLEAKLARRIGTWAQRQGITERIRVWSMARHLVRELLLEKCPTCFGTGVLPIVVHEVSDRLHESDCPTCLGSGRRAIDERGRAMAAVGDATAYGAVAQFYEYVLTMIARAEARARGQMARRLKRDE